MRRTGFEIADAEHSDDGIFAKYLLRAVRSSTRQPT